MLTAKDGGTPQLTGSTQVKIPMENTNDEAPVILMSTNGWNVDEDATGGTTVGNIQATDVDGSGITFSFKGKICDRI
jgi:hypothetical protein